MATIDLSALERIMIFIKFIAIYLLVSVSYLFYTMSKLEPDHVLAISDALGALGGILILVVFLVFKGGLLVADQNGKSDALDEENHD